MARRTKLARLWRKQPGVSTKKLEHEWSRMLHRWWKLDNVRKREFCAESYADDE